MRLLFDYLPGMDITEMGGTFTRATPAWELDRNGIVQERASGVLRDAHFIDGVRYVLLEPTRINSCSRSYDLTATWSGIATTALNGVGLQGLANTATTVTDDDGALHENKIFSIAIANDNATHAVEIWVKKDNDESRFPQIGAQLSGGATPVRYTPSINTKTGAFVAANQQGTGTQTVVDGGDWWIVRVTVTNNTSGHTSLQLIVYPAVRSVITGPDAAATMGSVVIGHAQAELNATFNTSPIITNGATVTRNADVLTFGFAHDPQEMTAYVKGLALGQFLINSADILRVGSGAGQPRFYLEHYQLEGRFRVFSVDGAGNVGSSYPTPTPAFGDTIEGRGVLHSDASVTGGIAINGGSETTAAQSAAPAAGLASAWSEETLHVTQSGFALRSLRIMAGTQTMATMRVPLSYIRFDDVEGIAYLSNEKPFPANRFQSWTPDSMPFGDSANTLATGARVMLRLRDDFSASFELPMIPSVETNTVVPTQLAARLMYHLRNGGTCMVVTGDAEPTVYSVCGLKPGSEPQIALSNRQTMEYTLSLALLNQATTPDHMHPPRYRDQ